MSVDVLNLLNNSAICEAEVNCCCAFSGTDDAYNISVSASISFGVTAICNALKTSDTRLV